MKVDLVFDKNFLTTFANKFIVLKKEEIYGPESILTNTKKFNNAVTAIEPSLLYNPEIFIAFLKQIQHLSKLDTLYQENGIAHYLNKNFYNPSILKEKFLNKEVVEKSIEENGFALLFPICFTHLNPMYKKEHVAVMEVIKKEFFSSYEGFEKLLKNAEEYGVSKESFYKLLNIASTDCFKDWRYQNFLLESGDFIRLLNYNFGKEIEQSFFDNIEKFSFKNQVLLSVAFDAVNNVSLPVGVINTLNKKFFTDIDNFKLFLDIVVNVKDLNRYKYLDSSQFKDIEKIKNPLLKKMYSYIKKNKSAYLTVLQTNHEGLILGLPAPCHNPDFMEDKEIFQEVVRKKILYNPCIVDKIIELYFEPVDPENIPEDMKDTYISFIANNIDYYEYFPNKWKESKIVLQQLSSDIFDIKKYNISLDIKKEYLEQIPVTMLNSWYNNSIYVSLYRENILCMPDKLFEEENIFKLNKLYNNVCRVCPSSEQPKDNQTAYIKLEEKIKPFLTVDNCIKVMHADGKNEVFKSMFPEEIYTDYNVLKNICIVLDSESGDKDKVLLGLPQKVKTFFNDMEVKDKEKYLPLFEEYMVWKVGQNVAVKSQSKKNKI